MSTQDIASRETCQCNRCDCEACNFGVARAAKRLSNGILASKPNDHFGFKRAMQLSGSAHPALIAHTSQSNDSGVNALLDIAAVMLDITAFYDERVLNEGFLNTARQRLSVKELARSIGYELSPGVSASTHLALEVGTAPGLDEWITVPSGVQVQSLPMADEQPQTFETVETVTGHTAWNDLAVRLHRPQQWTAGKSEILVEGKQLGLAIGGILVLVFPNTSTPVPVEIQGIEEDFDRQITSVKLGSSLEADYASQPIIYAFKDKATAFGASAPDWRSLPAAAKREYLGLPEDAQIPAADRYEWPDFTIHLPGTTPARFGAATAVLDNPPPLEFTPETVVKQVKMAMADFSGVSEQALSARMSNAAFGTYRTGIASVDAVGKSIRMGVDSVKRAFANFQGTVNSSTVADKATDVVQSVVSALGSVVLLTPTALDATTFETALGELVDELGKVNPMSAINSALGDIVDALQGEVVGDAADALMRAGRSIVESANEYQTLTDSATRLALVQQAEHVVGAALDMALQATPPEGFSRRAFVTFVAATMSNVLVLPNKFSPAGDAFVNMLSGNIEDSDPMALLEPSVYENFNPNAFRAASPDSVTYDDLALTSIAVASYPQVVVPYAALASMTQLATYGAQSAIDFASNSGMQPTLLQYFGIEPDAEEAAQWSPIEQAGVDTREVILNALQPQTLTQLEMTELTQFLFPSSIRTDTVSLDSEYRSIVAGPDAKVFLDAPRDHKLLLDVDGAETVSRSDFALSGKSTVITTDAATIEPLRHKVRTLTVHGGSFRLAVAAEADPSSISGDTFEIPAWTEFPVGSGAVIKVPKPKAGQAVIVTGLTAAGDPQPHAQYAKIESATYLSAFGSWPEPHWRIVLDRQLDAALDRQSVHLHGNIALANHGQSFAEIVNPERVAGGYVSLALAGNPVTHVSSPTDPSGAKSSLQLMVDGETWTRTNDFLSHTGEEKIYTERVQDDGTTQLGFIAGSHLPQLKNMQASYRIGLGAGGNLAAQRLQNLLSRPLGLVGAQQPLVASGGEDPESLENARQNAPLTVKTLDRLVVLDDYADFAKAFAGISKAQAAWAWFGQAQGVLLTVAGANGDVVAADSELALNLRGAIDNYRDAAVPVEIVSYQRVPFGITLRLYFDQQRDPETIRIQAHEQLAAAHAFEPARLAQAVLASRIFDILHGIEGVLGVDLDALHRSGSAAVHASRLPARAGRVRHHDVASGAELLTLDEQHFSISMVPMAPTASIAGESS